MQQSAYGDNGNDVIYGSDYVDYLEGNEGNDIIYANGGNDTVRGYGGNDIILGAAGTIPSYWVATATIRSLAMKGTILSKERPAMTISAATPEPTRLMVAMVPTPANQVKR